MAGPGFINFRLTTDWLTGALRDVAARGEAYGRVDPSGRRAQVEFVSANPTGPLHIGHARNAALGDALARVLEAAGWSVEREYYFNDTGGQMDRFGASVEARYLQLLGREAEVPEDGYHGDYVVDLARRILETEGPGPADLPPDERVARLQHEAARLVLEQIDGTLERFGVRFDSFMHERVLADKGLIDAAVQRLRDAGLRVRRGGGGLVPLDRVRRRQGSAARAIERDAHVLRRRLRVRDRQVRAGVRAPRVRVGRRSSRRRRAGARGRAGARVRRRAARDRDLPMGLVPARRGAGPDEQARRRVRQPRRADRRGRARTRRGSTC